MSRGCPTVQRHISEAARRRTQHVNLAHWKRAWPSNLRMSGGGAESVPKPEPIRLGIPKRDCLGRLCSAQPCTVQLRLYCMPLVSDCGSETAVARKKASTCHVGHVEFCSIGVEHCLEHDALAPIRRASLNCCIAWLQRCAVGAPGLSQPRGIGSGALAPSACVCERF